MKVRKAISKDKPRDFGNKREKAIAGGDKKYTHTPGSGSSGVKGDLRRGNFMVEVKATRADSFRVTADILGKLHNDSLFNGRPGVLIVEIGTGERYAILPLSLFESLTNDSEIPATES